MPARNNGEMGSGDAPQHGEEGEQERSGGGARRRSEIAEYGVGNCNSDERLGVILRCDLIGAKGRKEEEGEGFIAMVMGQ